MPSCWRNLWELFDLKFIHRNNRSEKITISVGNKKKLKKKTLKKNPYFFKKGILLLFY